MTETVTLKSIAKAWGAGLITLDEAMSQARTIEFPVYHKSESVWEGEGWYDGDIDNTSAGVAALRLSVLTPEQYFEFMSAFNALKL